MSKTRFINFLVNKQIFSLEISNVHELCQLNDTLVKINNVPNHVLGVFNRQNNIMQVWDLNKYLFNVATEIQRNQYIIVLKNGADKIACIVDSVNDFIDAEEKEIQTIEMYDSTSKFINRNNLIHSIINPKELFSILSK